MRASETAVRAVDGEGAAPSRLALAPASLAPAALALPRARALTDALASVPQPSVDVDALALLADRLASALRRVGDRGAPAAPAGPARHRHDPTGCVRIGAYQLVSGGRAGTASAGATRFQWTARRARRAIGLSALRSVLDGHSAAPADAVAAVVGDPGGPGGLGAQGPGSCGDWLQSLSPAARAGVRAEATTWATQLYCALEWERLDPPPIVGAPDRWWVCGSKVRVALRGRADVRLAGGGGVHLSMLPGHPSAESRMALCLSALVDLLARGPAGLPARVAGWWPEAGKAWIVPVDAAALSAVADAAGRVAAMRTRYATVAASTR